MSQEKIFIDFREMGLPPLQILPGPPKLKLVKTRIQRLILSRK